MSKCELSLKVLRIPNFSQITHSSIFGSKCELSLKSIADSYFFSVNARREIHTAAVVLFSKIFVSPKMVAILHPPPSCLLQKTPQNLPLQKDIPSLVLLSVPCGTLVCVWETFRLRRLCRLRILFSL